MSLQGTFDTLSVGELFALLSTAGKTGALRLEASEHAASVFVSAGRCCAVESDEVAGPAGSDHELASRLVDVGFAFARMPTGSFRFSDSEPGTLDTTVTTALEPAVVEIRALLDQWREIEATIPSLDVRLRLAPVLRDREIVVTAAEWGLLVAMEGMPTVRELVAQLRQPMLQVCRDVKGLVDRGAIEVGADVAVLQPHSSHVGEHAHHGSDAGSGPMLDPIEPYAPGVERAATGDAVPVGLEAMAADAAAEVRAVATDVGDAAVEADAVVAGIVSRMTRSKRPVPDAFGAGACEPAVEVSLVATGGGADDDGDDDETATGRIGTAAEAGEVPQDRGALLRLFSALKEN